MRTKLAEPPKRCLITGSPKAERHHVYGGTRRKLSEKWGAIAYLAKDFHTGKHGVHNGNKELRLMLQAETQKRFEAAGWTREEFIGTFGQNYIDDEDNS